MKIVDVTLRDGGFVCDFDWGFDYAVNHIKTMVEIGVNIIELGYWKQSSKSKNPFYNMNDELLEKLAQYIPKTIRTAVMIDFHYCSKDLEDYPNFGFSRLDIIRITSRKEDFEDAVKFGRLLKEKKGLKVSFQIINSTNYSKKELMQSIEKLIENSFDMVAFADSHGNLNLIQDIAKYEEAFKLLDDNSVRWSFHLHDHTGRATLNYWYLTQTSCYSIDVSANGVGKGTGNLKLDYVISNEMLPILLEYMTTTAHQKIKIEKIEAFNLMTGRLNITDNYAKYALSNNLTIKDFFSILIRISGKDRDTYNENLIKRLSEELI